MTATFSILRADPRSAEISALLDQSIAHACALYPPESVHVWTPQALSAPNVTFLAAWEAGRVLGCGALVAHSGGWGELKSLFTVLEVRRRGVATAILNELEALAPSVNVRTLRLETGIEQPAAIALYCRKGFRERGPFHDYRPDPLSVFMEKRLCLVCGCAAAGLSKRAPGQPDAVDRLLNPQPRISFNERTDQ